MFLIWTCPHHAVLLLMFSIVQFCSFYIFPISTATITFVVSVKFLTNAFGAQEISPVTNSVNQHKIIYIYLISNLSYLVNKKSQQVIRVSSFSAAFLCFKKWKYGLKLLIGQNKQLKDIPMGSGNLWWTFVPFLSTIYTINNLIIHRKTTERFISDENNSWSYCCLTAKCLTHHILVLTLDI